MRLCGPRYTATAMLTNFTLEIHVFFLSKHVVGIKQTIINMNEILRLFSRERIKLEP